jgi:hypothetical protein
LALDRSKIGCERARMSGAAELWTAVVSLTGGAARAAIA